MEPSPQKEPHLIQQSWLKAELTRIDQYEAAILRFGTVYARYEIVPRRPHLEKPRGHTYLTHARRLIPRRKTAA